jgi:quercetin dioxygenase-like cupin family protein
MAKTSTKVTLKQEEGGPSPKKLKLSATPTSTELPTEFDADARIYEYTSAANPSIPQVPVLAHPASLHESGPTRVIPFDLSRHMGITYAATSPNLMASFVRINPGDEISTDATATSQAFYIIRGSGSSVTEHGTITWGEGDLFVVPASDAAIVHRGTADTAIYWVTDEPLMNYLGVKPNVKKFNVTLFRKERMLAEVERIKHQPGAEVPHTPMTW